MLLLIQPSIFIFQPSLDVQLRNRELVGWAVPMFFSSNSADIIVCDVDQSGWFLHRHFVPSLVLDQDEMKQKLAPFVDHLTYLDYQCVFSPPGYYTATHVAKVKFFMYWLAFDGLTVAAPFEITPAIADDEVGFLQFLNSVNGATGAAKYFRSQGRWVIQASYSGDYERGRFAHFLESFFLGIAAPRDLFPAEGEKYFGIPQAR